MDLKLYDPKGKIVHVSSNGSIDMHGCDQVNIKEVIINKGYSVGYSSLFYEEIDNIISPYVLPSAEEVKKYIDENIKPK